MGRLSAQVERLQLDVQQINKTVSKQNDQLARWRGAGAVLTLIGAGVGYFGSAILGKVWP
jgi:hypothetical protein